MSEVPKMSTRAVLAMFIGLIGSFIGFGGRLMFRNKGLTSSLIYRWMPTLFNKFFFLLGGTLFDAVFQFIFILFLIFPFLGFLEKRGITKRNYVVAYLLGIYGGLNMIDGLWRILFMISSFSNWYEYVF